MEGDCDSHVSSVPSETISARSKTVQICRCRKCFDVEIIWKRMMMYSETILMPYIFLLDKIMPLYFVPLLWLILFLFCNLALTFNSSYIILVPVHKWRLLYNIYLSTRKQIYLLIFILIKLWNMAAYFKYIIRHLLRSNSLNHIHK